MSERPIEEIIGWRHSRDEYLNCEWYNPGLDGIGSLHERAEVDDLADWLNDRICWASWELYHDCERWYIDLEGETTTPASFSTIREALVAAVRKVAGR